MCEFVRNLEELLYLASQKYRLVSHLTKNYKENIHYIIEKNKFNPIKQNGGQNKITYLLTEEAFELLKNTYNLRNKYIVDLSKNVKYIKQFIQCEDIQSFKNSTINICDDTHLGVDNNNNFAWITTNIVDFMEEICNALNINHFYIKN